MLSTILIWKNNLSISLCRVTFFCVIRLQNSKYGPSCIWHLFNAFEIYSVLIHLPLDTAAGLSKIKFLCFILPTWAGFSVFKLQTEVDKTIVVHHQLYYIVWIKNTKLIEFHVQQVIVLTIRGDKFSGCTKCGKRKQPKFTYNWVVKNFLIFFIFKYLTFSYILAYS